jgi:membrane associated rhomboid family serine protease
MASTDTPEPAASVVPTCYRHPDRETYVRCTRCNRPICPDCMRSAAVGFHCPECVAEGARTQRSARTLFGGSVPTRGAVVTMTLIALSVVAFLIDSIVPGNPREWWMVGLQLDDSGNLAGLSQGEWWRLLTAAFLHGGILHLLFNMYALYLFGPQLEAAFGHVRFAVLYVLSALGGSAVSYLFANPVQPSLGASGAVFGILGATLVVSRRLRYDVRGVTVLIGINLALGFVIEGIDWRAHLGGLITGMAVAYAFAYAPRDRRTLIGVGASVLVFLATVGIVAFRTAQLTG